MNGIFQKLPLFFRGLSAKRICPVCCNNEVTFLPLPTFYKEKAEQYGYVRFGQGEMISLEEYSCSSCGASDRERVYAFWIDEMIKRGRFKKGAKVIHFAPEPSLSRKLRSLKTLDYSTADLCMDNVDSKVDIMQMPFEDSVYDLFICSHVLEHVESDDKAIAELFRITKKGGCGILVAPISIGLNKTLEDASVVTEDERWKYYGQGDHLRLYAHDDYVRKIKSHGFDVQELGVDYFGHKLFHMLGMKETSILYIVDKP